MTAAYSLAFDADGTRLYCGFNRCIRAFDVARPGRDYRTISTYQKKQEGQPGEHGSHAHTRVEPCSPIASPAGSTVPAGGRRLFGLVNVRVGG